MTSDLTTDFLEFHFSSTPGAWSVAPRIGPGPRISDVRMSAAWTVDGENARWDGRMDSADGPRAETAITPHGEARQLRARIPLDRAGLALLLEWRAPSSVPLLFWRGSLENHSERPIHIEKIELFGAGATPSEPGPPRASSSTWDWNASGGRLGFYSNGWQSWGYTGTLSPHDRYPRTRLGPLTSPMRVNEGTPQPLGRGHFSSDFYGVLGSREARSAVLLGFLSQRQTFGTLEARLSGNATALRLWANGDHARLDPGARLDTDWACLQFVDPDADDPLGPYLDAVALENSARNGGEVPVGWCSWYQFFQKVSEKDIYACLDWAAAHRSEVPLSLIQIDDGFQLEVGDWFETNARFSDGMREPQERIRRAGFRAGLWLAPFIARPGARAIREHPEWVLRGSTGRSASAGFIWNTRTRALDTTHPGVLEHLDRVIRTARREWGFDYLKLDFLYAAALPGIRYDPTVTRAMALQRGLTALRDAAGEDTFLVGCGCPIGSGIGIFDAMRISCDVAPRWNPAYLGIEPFFRAEPDFPSARNAIRNIFTRAHLHRRWWVNDPDCLLLRETFRPGALGPKECRQHLTDAEVQCLATAIALSAGSLLVSDNLPGLGAERARWLARLIPPLPRAARVLDWFDEASPSRLLLPLVGPTGAWCLLALVNWGDSHQDFRVDLGRSGATGTPPYHVVDFWRGEYRRVETEWIDAAGVPPHGVRLVAVRPLRDAPQWVGDTLHISQGLGVERWSVMGSHIEADLALGHRGDGTAFLSLPAAPVGVTLDDSPVAWRSVAEGVYALEVSPSARSVLRVSWG